MRKQTRFKTYAEACKYLKLRGWAQVSRRNFTHTKIHGYWREVYKEREGVWKTRPL